MDYLLFVKFFFNFSDKINVHINAKREEVSLRCILYEVIALLNLLLISM